MNKLFLIVDENNINCNKAEDLLKSKMLNYTKILRKDNRDLCIKNNINVVPSIIKDHIKIQGLTSIRSALEELNG